MTERKEDAKALSPVVENLVSKLTAMSHAGEAISRKRLAEACPGHSSRDYTAAMAAWKDSRRNAMDEFAIDAATLKAGTDLVYLMWAALNARTQEFRSAYRLDCDTELKENRAAMGACEDELEKSKQTLAETRKAVDHLRLKSESQETEISRLREENDKAKETIVVLRTKVEEKDKTIEHLNSALEKLDRQFRALNSKKG